MNKTKGFTLIEGIISLIILGIATVSVLSMFISNIRVSSDDLEYRQSVQLAKSMLEEVIAKPFTYCDLTDPNFLTATSTASCTTVENMGYETGESRYSATSPFNNVNDYNGFNMTGIKDLTGTSIIGLENYSLSITVTNTAIGAVPASDCLKIVITVTSPKGNVFSLISYRTRYAPNL